MEKYFINFDGDYIFSIGEGVGDMEITKEEYENIVTIVKNRPIEENKCYKLKKDLTWDALEVEVIPEDEMEITDDEFMDMLEEVL